MENSFSWEKTVSWSNLSCGAQASVDETRIIRKTYEGPLLEWPLISAWAQDPHLAFVRETKALGALAATNSHHMFPFPHILCVTSDQSAVIMTDCGKPLSEAWDLAPKQARDWRKQLLDILDCMRTTKVYHNDVHPGNVTVDRDGRLKLIDFAWATFDAPNFPEMNMTPDDILQAETLPQVFDFIFERAVKHFDEPSKQRVNIVKRMHDKHKECAQQPKAKRHCRKE